VLECSVNCNSNDDDDGDDILAIYIYISCVCVCTCALTERCMLPCEGAFPRRARTHTQSEPQTSGDGPLKQTSH